MKGFYVSANGEIQGHHGPLGFLCVTPMFSHEFRDCSYCVSILLLSNVFTSVSEAIRVIQWSLTRFFFFPDQYSCEFGSAKYYALCGFGGILSCGITHTAVVPLDLVKCRIQVDPAKYGSIVKGFRVTIAENGYRGLGLGWAPTFIGYSMQGLCKFGFYEVFKNLYSGLLGEV